MTKKTLSRRFRTLVMLACSLSILAVAFEGRITHVKAQTHPVCVTLGIMTTLLSGTVDYCGASGLPQPFSLGFQATFDTELLAGLMVNQSTALLGQELVFETFQVANDYQVHLSLNE
jgi:hypothetical protein